MIGFINKWIVLLLFFTYSQSYGQILIENGEPAAETRQSYAHLNGQDFRRKRKVGVGLMAAGISGLLGVNIELNFTPLSSLVLGFGGSGQYQSYHFQYKRVLLGQHFLPYLSFGLGKWYTTKSSGSIGNTTPGFLEKRFLSDSEKARGEFDETFIFPSLGIQYAQLSGSWAGTSLFAEVTLLIDIDDLVTSPTGGLGVLYYF